MDMFGSYRDADGRPFTLDEFQKEYLTALVRHQRLGLLACKGPGKSMILAVGGLWFMFIHKDSEVVCTSITADNLRDGLWKELGKWMRVNPIFDLLFSKTNTRIEHRERGDLWFASARAWPRTGDATQQADSMAGIHADRVMAIIDEAGGVPLSVLHALEAVLTSGPDCRLVLAGNPTSTDGALYQACKVERHLYWVKEIDNDPDNPKRCKRADLGYAQKLIGEYGRNHDIVRVNVLGKFPRTGSDNLISEEEVEEAMRRHIPRDEWEDAQKRLGADIARFGDDASVIAPRQGRVAFHMRERRGYRTTQMAAEILVARNRFQSEMEFIDAGGVGAGVVDAYIAQGGSPVPVDFGEKALDSEMFYNRRTEMWWQMAAWIKRGAALPPDPELKQDLTKIKLLPPDEKGRIRLEPKKDFKKRTGRSPDHGDALALTFALPEMPAAGTAGAGAGKNRRAGNKIGKRG
jgi:hypothetical protein